MDDDIRPEDARRFPDADCDRHTDQSGSGSSTTPSQGGREH
jgi:hypothetical protein